MDTEGRSPQRAPAADVFLRQLGSPHRLDFLQALTQGPRPAAVLARRAGLSTQEAMRHLALLREVGLVERRRDRAYALAGLGASLVGDAAVWSAFLGDRSFLQRRDLTFVPPHLSLGPLARGPMAIGSEGAHLGDLARLYSVAAPFAQAGGPFVAGLPYCGEPEAPVPLPPAKSWTLMQTEAEVMTPRFLQDLPRLLSECAHRQARVRVLVVPRLPVLLSFNDREALMFLKDSAGMLDLRMRFGGEDPTFVAWTRALFAHLARSAVLAFDTARGDDFTAWTKLISAAVESVPRR